MCMVPKQGGDKEAYKILQVRLLLNFFLNLGNISYSIKICLTLLESLNEQIITKKFRPGRGKK